MVRVRLGSAFVMAGPNCINRLQAENTISVECLTSQGHNFKTKAQIWTALLNSTPRLPLQSPHNGHSGHLQHGRF